MASGRHPARADAQRRQGGFTYIFLLLTLTLLALATQGVLWNVSQQAMRERERDLLRVGEAYVEAIGSYYQSTPGTVKQWPMKIDDLLEDKRHVSIKRHLRTHYPDPMTRETNWSLVRAPDGGIMGVKSASNGTPIRTTIISLKNMALPAAKHYSDWSFVYTPPPPPAAPR